MHSSETLDGKRKWEKFVKSRRWRLAERWRGLNGSQMREPSKDNFPPVKGRCPQEQAPPFKSTKPESLSSITRRAFERPLNSIGGPHKATPKQQIAALVPRRHFLTCWRAKIGQGWQQDEYRGDELLDCLGSDVEPGSGEERWGRGHDLGREPRHVSNHGREANL